MSRAIAGAIAKLFKAGVGALRWAENLVLSPFRAIFGGGGALPRPEFAPNMTSSCLKSMKQTVRHSLSFNVRIATVLNR